MPHHSIVRIADPFATQYVRGSKMNCRPWPFARSDICQPRHKRPETSGGERHNNGLDRIHLWAKAPLPGSMTFPTQSLQAHLDRAAPPCFSERNFPCNNRDHQSCRKRFRSQLTGSPIGADHFCAALVIVQALGFQVRKTSLAFSVQLQPLHRCNCGKGLCP